MLAVAHNLTDRQDHTDELAALQCQILNCSDVLTGGMLYLQADQP